eukprot:TRINITY_DN13458_c0_g1_i3.p1 TRINITY_DN13458_c0_g1~~TRINITY_DN13458_c0_g1_i3.p1  ORF type:complete len:150 (-),score=4.80 TRINITY_DN13458_c0_g1_i3:24-473(-)
MRVGAWLTPTTMRVFNQKCHYRSCTYGQPNFGTIEIDWNANPVAVEVGVRDVNGDPATSVNVLLSELQASSANSKPTMNSGEIRHYCSLEIDLPWFIRYRLAILFYIAVSGMFLIILSKKTPILSFCNYLMLELENVFCLIFSLHCFIL